MIWTTNRLGRCRNGFVGNFFGIFEATTNHSYKQMLARIAANNKMIEHGGPGEFGRTITVRELSAEVPLHYLFNFNQRRFREAVDQGVKAARAWCDANHISHKEAQKI